MIDNTKIREEKERIGGYFSALPSGELAVVTPLIENAAFMKVTLEDLQSAIVEQGTTDSYQNGSNQFGQKISAQLQSYNSLLKNYVSVVKSLYQYLPTEVRKTSSGVFALREKTPEELEAERKAEDEKQKRIREEIQRASEYQRQQREGKA